MESPETSVTQLLPQGLMGLSFEKDVFMRDDFDVDTFVVKYRKSVNLETLRDDLSMYLKILQSAMIELINKDYADFVNLSTNLVGMDKAIKNITVPLGQLKEEVLSVKSAMHAAITTMEEKLKQRQKLRDRREALQRLVNITESVDKIERLLKIHQTDESTSSTELSGKLIERVATEFNKLQFYVTKSSGHPLVERVRPRIVAITTTLQYSLEGAFLGGLETGNHEILRQCLRTYALIDKTTEAENLFSQNVVRPLIRKIITEQAIKSVKDGVKSMYTTLLNFVPTHCQILEDVTSAKDHGDEIRGYDFVVNCVWPEIVSALDTQASSVFAPGNPAVFHQRYRESMSFLERFELLCGSKRSVKRLRAHPSYSLFMTKWSLPVYFQIRFQEIAGSLESVLSGNEALHAAKDSQLKLQGSAVLLSCIHDCWHDHIFLPPLSHRFLKLTFQLISRYSLWVEDTYQLLTSPPEKPRIDPPDKLGTGDTAIEGGNSVVERITMPQIVSLVCDIQTLSKKILELYEVNVLPKVTECGVTNTQAVKDCFIECQQSIQSTLPKYNAYIVTDIVSQCSVHVKQVTDIPRLYRRTNREAPSKSSVYIDSIMQPLRQHIDDLCGSLSADNRTRLVCDVIANLTKQYHTMTGDVLTSVKKMEDSLKRLKKARGGQVGGTGVVTDDDKIRRQIVLDVTKFISWIENFGVTSEVPQCIEQLNELSASAKAAMSA